jgi:hypothetical protein
VVLDPPLDHARAEAAVAAEADMGKAAGARLLVHQLGSTSNNSATCCAVISFFIADDSDSYRLG